MPANDQYANNPASTLSAGIAAGDTTLTVASAALFSAVPQFRIILDSEILLVTGVSGTTFTVARGVEGTTAASHSSGAAVTQILSRDGLLSVGSQIHYSDSYAAIPSSSLVGRTFWPNNGFTIYRDTGSAWSPWGPIYPMVPPDDSQFSWNNQTSNSVTGTVSQANGGIFLLAPKQSGGEAPRIREIALPTAPYTVTMGFMTMAYPANFWGAGLIMRDSAGGQAIEYKVGFSSNGNVGVNKYTNITTFSAAYVQVNLSDMPEPIRFIQIQDDSTNWHFNYSFDGQHFSNLFTVARNDFVTPTKIGFFANSINASHDCGCLLLSWQVTNP